MNTDIDRRQIQEQHAARATSLHGDDVIVLPGRGGLGTPSYRTWPVITIECSIMSRTGRSYGDVNEGLCVQVSAYLPAASGERWPLTVERLYAQDRWDAEGTNSIGGRGCFHYQQPSQEAIDEAAQRAREAIEAGGDPKPLRIVVAPAA